MERRWKKEFRVGAGNAFPGNGKQPWSGGKGCLRRIEGTADAAGVDWESAVYRKIEEEVKR